MNTKESTGGAPLLRIQEVAAEVGATPRSVRYWEEQGLLRPAARSDGDYRLYDATDLERLRFIKALRDDAGFSLAEIAQLLEDEDARERAHAAFHATEDPAERKGLLLDRLTRFDRQISTLRTKIERLESMIADTEARRARTRAKLTELESSAAAARPPETVPPARDAAAPARDPDRDPQPEAAR